MSLQDSDRVAAGPSGETGTVPPVTRDGSRLGLTAPAIAIPAFIMLLGAAVRLYDGITELFQLGVFARVSDLIVSEGESLTVAGRQLIMAGFDIAVGVTLLLVFVGFLRRYRWGWIMAMTWVATSLIVSLIRYALDDPRYLAMFGSVVLMLALNRAVVHRAFGLGSGRGDNSE